MRVYIAWRLSSLSFFPCSLICPFTSSFTLPNRIFLNLEVWKLFFFSIPLYLPLPCVSTNFVFRPLWSDLVTDLLFLSIHSVCGLSICCLFLSTLYLNYILQCSVYTYMCRHPFFCLSPQNKFFFPMPRFNMYSRFCRRYKYRSSQTSLAMFPYSIQPLLGTCAFNSKRAKGCLPR